MTDREKMYELIDDFDALSTPTDGFRHHLADHLLANGVVVREKGEWTEHQHTSYDDMREENVIWFTYACSECGGEVMNDYDFCPNCGADMRKGENG